MKPIHIVILFLAVGVGLGLMRTQNSSNVLGTVVGVESKEICWHGIKDADKYQVYFGQSSTGNKDTGIYAGLDNRSKCVKLSYLKPCTEYIWNLNRLDGGKWTWQWESDQRFSTGGKCDTLEAIPTSTIVGNGKGMVTWNVADGATKYYIYYRPAGDANWSHSVEVGPNATNYTINYLDTNRSYNYRVAALVNGKLLWQNERNLMMK